MTAPNFEDHYSADCHAIVSAVDRSPLLRVCFHAGSMQPKRLPCSIAACFILIGHGGIDSCMVSSAGIFVHQIVISGLAVVTAVYFKQDCMCNERQGSCKFQNSALMLQGAVGYMRLFMWYQHHKAVGHCLSATLKMAQTRYTYPSSHTYLNMSRVISPLLETF